MEKVFRSIMNVFVAITLAAFIISAIPSHVFAASSDASITHIADSQKGEPVHQKDGQCDDGCCISHCFCSGYAIQAFQTFFTPILHSSIALTGFDQKAEGMPAMPQLRPPRILV